MKILPLAEITAAGTSEFGGKAVSLARLIRAGLPVPDGFAIGASVEFSASSDWQNAPGLLQAIQQNFEALQAPLVAVRSSAIAEDQAGASSAGIYHSFLGIADLPSLLAAIRKCWASLATAQAIAYRQRAGLEAQAGMAVIVQRLVQAEAAGVAFTTSPINPAAIQIEAAWGLGESVVSGRVEPDRFFLRRDGLRIFGQSVGHKPLRLVMEAGAIVEQPMPLDLQSSPSITGATVMAIARLALAIERKSGAPQDIEWAYADGNIFVLQARPITTQSKAPQVWSNLNAAEVLPRPVSPLAQSLLAPCAEGALVLVLERLGMSVGKIELTREIAGRTYFNVNLLAAILDKLPRAFRIDLDGLLGGSDLGAEGLDFKSLGSEETPAVRFHWWRLLWSLPGLARWFLFGALRETERHITASRLQCRHAQSQNSSAADNATLTREIQAALQALLDCANGLSGSLVAMRYFDALDAVCRRWFPAEPDLTARLVAAGGVASAEAPLALWRLAAQAKQHPTLHAGVETASSSSELRSNLAGTSDGAAFLALWEDYLIEHGHHAMGELDLMTPRWSEDETALLQHLRAYLSASDKTNPVEVQERRREAAQFTASACRRKLNLIQCFVFSFLVGRTNRGAQIRENMKSVLVEHISVARKLLLEQAARWIAAGHLNDGDDIFFLRRDELASLSGAPPDAKSREWIAARRREHQDNLLVSPPSIVVGDYRPLPFRENATMASAAAWRGLGVSPGVARGQARVFSDHTSTERILPGEILVAPYADPGWSLHFLQASAIVVDLGGMLSHGSIIARELGIPAVANVQTASRLIRTGQLLEVDGNLGTVRVLGE